jgi:hypothetical protein
MHFPANTTPAEMQTLLHQLRNENFPDEDASFINQLDEEGLRFIFDVIGEKDEQKREGMWRQLEQKIANAEKEKVSLVQHTMQKANHLFLQYREQTAKSQDITDLEQLELNF